MKARFFKCSKCGAVTHTTDGTEPIITCVLPTDYRVMCGGSFSVEITEEKYNSIVNNYELGYYKNIGFVEGTLKNITGCNINKNQKIIYKKLPYYDKSYIYSFVGNFDVFYFGDEYDSEFFTIKVASINQIKDLLSALDYKKY